MYSSMEDVMKNPFLRRESHPTEIVDELYYWPGIPRWSMELPRRELTLNVVICLIIVSLASVQFGYTLGYSSPTQSGLISDLGITSKQLYVFASLANVGAIVGAGTSLHICRYLGLKCSLIIASVSNILGWVTIYFGREKIAFLFIGRLLTGFGIGIISYAVPIYMAEIAPKSFPRKLGAVNQLGISIGVMIVYLLGVFLGWRMIAVLGIVPGAILIPCLYWIPESPFWLVKKGRIEDCENSLNILRGFDADTSQELGDIRYARMQAITSLAYFRRRKYWLPLMLGISLQSLQQLSGINAVIFYSSTIFESAGVSEANIATFVLGAIAVVATLAVTWLMRKVGRRVLLLISSIGMTIGLLLVAQGFYIEEIASEDSKVYSTMMLFAVAGIMATVICFSLGVGPLPWLIMYEIVPDEIRGGAIRAALVANFVFSGLITFSAYWLLDWSKGGSFVIYAAFAALTAVFVGFLIPETKERTPEAIQPPFIFH